MQLTISSGSSDETSRSIEVDVGEALEQDRLAFHHRLGRQRAAIAQPQNGGSVGDDGDEVALGGIIKGEVLVLGDSEHWNGDAG